MHTEQPHFLPKVILGYVKLTPQSDHWETFPFQKTLGKAWVSLEIVIITETERPTFYVCKMMA